MKKNNPYRLLAILAILGLLASAAYGALSKQYEFSSGTVISSSEVNANFDDLFDAIGTQVFTADYALTDNQTTTASLEALDVAIGAQAYTDDNFVTDSESVTDSLDALDMITGTSSYLESNYVDSGDTVFGAIDKLDRQIYDNVLFLRGYLSGCSMENDSGDAANDVTVNIGTAMSSGNTKYINLTTAVTKKIDAVFAVGTDQGGLDTGAAGPGTWYNVYLIEHETSGATDVLLSGATTSLTMPSGYTYSRRVGSVYAGLGSGVSGFVQHGDKFLWKDPPLDVNSTAIGTTGTFHKLQVPYGVSTEAIIVYQGNTGESNHIYISSMDVNDEAPSNGTAPLGQMYGAAAAMGQMDVQSSVTGYIRLRADGANIDIDIATLGYKDRRGRDD